MDEKYFTIPMEVLITARNYSEVRLNSFFLVNDNGEILALKSAVKIFPLNSIHKSVTEIFAIRHKSFHVIKLEVAYFPSVGQQGLYKEYYEK